MNTNIFIAIAVIIIAGVVSSCEKVAVDEPEQLNYFMKLYGNYYNDRLNSIDITNNENIVLAGERTLEEGDVAGWLIMTDQAGMVEVERTYHLDNNVRVLGAYVRDNIYFTACEINPVSPHNGWVLVYDEMLNLTDSLSFSIDIEKVIGVEFLKMSDQVRFLLHGNNGNTDEILIYEIGDDNAVHLISRNEMYGTLQGRLYVYETANNTLYLAGSVPEIAGQVGPDAKSNIMVSCVMNDNIVWSYSHGEIGVSELCAGIVSVDDQLLVGGSQKISDENHFADSLFIYKLDDYGQIQSNQSVLLTGPNRAYEMMLNSNNELVWTGERKIDERNIRIFMARTTLNGQIILEVEYGDRGYSSGRRITMLPESSSGFLLSGILSTSGVSEDANDVLVIKVDKNGDWIE